ncbi:MAG: 50S ribosomal protein L5 [Methanosarcinales archaeon Met12]|nr:MAG: 50S ribosomal protein L5 [Methanosarcinales archaeon Met12]
MMNPMKTPKIHKVTINISLGEGGQKLLNAEQILTKISGQTPVRTVAKKTMPTFGIKRGGPVGCVVTLRKEAAEKFLRSALAIKDGQLNLSQFDENGNFSFGIEEHTDFPDMRYDPEIGIFGMDVSVALERPGYRVRRRWAKQHKIPSAHRLNKEDATAFIKDKFGAVVT